MTTDGVRLGDLLTGAGLLQASDLREAMMISKQQGLPVGRVLIMSGYLTEQHLQAAVQAQSLLKDGLIEFDIVIKALTMVGSEDITLEEAFKRLKWNQQSDAVTNKLGELLLAAEIVPVDALNAALLQCQSIGLPLGRVLIGNGNLTEQMLAATLNAQVFIRDKKLTREQAIQGLRSAKERQIPIEQYLAETGALSLPTAETVRLGELFVMAGLVDEPALMSAVEVGLLNEQPVGQVLLQTDLISQELLDAALDLQAMVGAGAIKKDEAAKFLSTVKNKKVSVGEAIALSHQKPSKKKAAAASAVEEPPMPAIEPLHLYQFLQLSGIITAKEIEQAIRVGSKNTEIMAKMLRLSGVMETALVDAAEKCNDLIAAGVLNHEQGMIVLKNCERNNFTLEQAFNELGWNTAPLRSDPGVPELLLDAPVQRKNAYDTISTTAQMPDAKRAESMELASAASSEAESISASSQTLPSQPSQASQPSSAESTSPTLTPLSSPATIESSSALLGGWPAPEAGSPAASNTAAHSASAATGNPFDAAQASTPVANNPFDAKPAAAAPTANPFEVPSAPPASNPFDQGSPPAAAESKSEADALAEFGSSINQRNEAAANAFGQSAHPSTAASGGEGAHPPQADPFTSSGDAWHSASPDEWMPKSADTAAPTPAATIENPAASASPAANDAWSSVGQAQMTADAWQGGQAQAGQGQAQSAPAAAPNAQAGAGDWNSPAAQDNWAAPEPSAQAPAVHGNPEAAQVQPPQPTTQTPAPAPAAAAQSDWNPAAGADDWGVTPAAPAASAGPAAGATDWGVAPGNPPAAATGAPANWGATPTQAMPPMPTQPGAAPNQAAGHAAAPSEWGAPNQSPAQPDWASSGSSSAPAQPEWGATPASSAASANEWAAPPQAQLPQTQLPQGQPPQGQPPQAAPAQQADWAGSSSPSMPALQPDWANSQAAPAAQAPNPAAGAQTEWQPPTSSAPQESAWGAPPEMPAQPAAAQAPAQAGAPAAAPSQPSWQSAAPSPLPGWQSTSSTNQDAWQPMPNSPAAQMFQEAAQSLQGAGAPPEGQHPAAEAAPQGPMDLFSDGDEDHSDQSDKPKKRLSDLMPKFGQKS